MKILVEKLVNGNYSGEYDQIDIMDELIFIELIKKKGTIKQKITCFHTSTGEYTPVTTLEGHLAALEQFGYAKLDSVNVVNLNKIEGLDESTNQVLFENGKKTSVTPGNSDAVRSILNKDSS